MKSIFPEPIRKLTRPDIPLEGLNAYLSQGDNHQVVFMEFTTEVILPEHSHAAQYGIVLEGRIDLTIDGVDKTFIKGDRYFIPGDTPHSGKIYAGYADVSFFDEPERYKPLKPLK